MTKQEIIDYVMTTPNNPNKAVLEGMLDGISGGDSIEPLTIYLRLNGSLDDEHLNPTGNQIYEWCITHNTCINGVLYAIDINFYYGDELLDRNLEGTNYEWWMNWQEGSDSLYFIVYPDGQIDCGMDGSQY